MIFMSSVYHPCKIRQNATKMAKVLDKSRERERVLWESLIMIMFNKGKQLL